MSGRRPNQPGLRPTTLLGAQIVLTVALFVASARELLLRAPGLYLTPLDLGMSARFWGFALGLAAGAFWASRRPVRAQRGGRNHDRPPGARRAIWTLAAVSALTSLAPLAWSFAFADSSRFWMSQPIMGASGCVLGVAGASATAWLAPHVRSLGFLIGLLSPLPLAVAALVGALALGAATQLPVAHAAATIGLALALVCSAAAELERYLTRQRLARADRLLAPALALIIAALGFVRGEKALPRAEVRGYGGDVLALLGGERQRLALVSHRSHFELYADRTLKLSSVDAHRYAEALVHPALAAARERRQVLLLGGGTGVVEREILRWKTVQKLTVIVTDRALSDFARRSPWLAIAAAGALDDPRVRIVEAEPIVWLAGNRQRFDAIVADIEDPIGYRQSKHYTRHAFTLAAASLAEGGIASIQAPSPLTFPRAFASIRATLAAAGLDAAPYHAALPAIGDAGFFLFAMSGVKPGDRVTERARQLPRQTRYVTPAALPGFFHFPADLRAALAEHAPANTLPTQPLVELYAQEHDSQPER